VANNEDSEKTSSDPPLSNLWKSVVVDFKTIRIVVLTAAVVVSLCSIPFLFILRNFVTFDALDKYLKVTESVSPRILHTISEEIETGYSKNIVLDSPQSHDNTLLFYAAKDQKILLTLDVYMRAGQYQNVGIQVDGCDVGVGQQDNTVHLYNRDITPLVTKCAQDNEPSVHTLRVYTLEPLKPQTGMDIRCLILVYEKLHAHVENAK
jgi:hypothetical protein